LAGDVKAGELARRTDERLAQLAENYAEVEVVRECEFKRQLAADKNCRQLFEEQYHVEPLHPRIDCLYGGRTQVFKVHHVCKEDEEIKHIDIVSSFLKK
jgi:hypothetical protein